MKRQFSVRERILMVILAILLIACVYYILVDKPVQDTLIDAAERQGEAESKLTIASAELKKMHRMQDALRQLEQSAEADVPDYDNAKNVVELLNRAMTMTNEYNLTFRPVNIERSIAKRTIQMNFSCDDYYSAKRVLQTLLDSDYRCRITSLSVNSGEKGDISQNKVTVNASVTFYEFLPNEQR